MQNIILRTLLTIAAIVSIIIDSYNDTVEIDDNRTHITIDVFKAISAIAVWFI